MTERASLKSVRPCKMRVTRAYDGQRLDAIFISVIILVIERLVITAYIDYAFFTYRISKRRISFRWLIYWYTLTLFYAVPSPRTMRASADLLMAGYRLLLTGNVAWAYTTGHACNARSAQGRRAL